MARLSPDEQRIRRELLKRGTCSFLDLKSVLKLSCGDIEANADRLARRGWVRIEKGPRGEHTSYTWTGPKEEGRLGDHVRSKRTATAGSPVRLEDTPKRRPKKTPPAREEENIAPGIDRHRVGNWIAERNVFTWRIPGSRLEFVVAHDYPYGSLFDAKQRAEEFLEGAGLPAHEPSLPPALPWGTGESEQARRYRERRDPAWYAYEILEAYSKMASILLRGETVTLDRIEGLRVIWPALEMAYRIGNLATEAHARGYLRKTGKWGGSKEKTIRPLMTWLRRTIEQYPDKPYTFYWNSLPDQDGGDRPERIDGARMIRDDDLLVVTDALGRKRFLTKTSFRRYVAIAKKSLKR